MNSMKLSLLRENLGGKSKNSSSVSVIKWTNNISLRLGLYKYFRLCRLALDLTFLPFETRVKGVIMDLKPLRFTRCVLYLCEKWKL